MAGSFTLSADQRRTFERAGVVRIPGAIGAAAAEAMADRLWAELEIRHALLRGRPETWTKEGPRQLGELRRSGAFAAMASPGVVELLDDFFGAGGWGAPRYWGEPLVTFPTAGPTGAPGAAWHLDILPGQRLTAWPDTVRVFAILASLEPGGGGTAYVAGSHRLALEVMARMRDGPPRSARIREALKSESPWIAVLCSPADEPGRMAKLASGAVVRGIELQLGEMTGEAGDVVLMHPAMLHAPAPNRRTTPRLMLAETVRAA